jgi:ribose-phosphate pyrophosphokinase
MLLNLDDVRSFNFPVGEMHVQLSQEVLNEKLVDLQYNFSGNESIVKLGLVVHTLRNHRVFVRKLIMPYIPFSREDRVFEQGGSFALSWFADYINSLNIAEIVVTDPHSQVATSLIKRCNVIHQWNIFAKYFKNKADFVLVAPDKGSRLKIQELDALVDAYGILTFEKKRDLSTGKILEHSPLDWKDEYSGKDFYVVDDLCDRGGTFVSVANKIKELSPNSKMVLMVSHGFFTHEKGVHVFDGVYDEVYTKDGRVM